MVSRLQSARNRDRVGHDLLGNPPRCKQRSSAPVLWWLRLEGLTVAALSATLYAHVGANWWLFAALWQVPDLAMFGYLAGPRWGGVFLQHRPHLHISRDAGDCRNHAWPFGLAALRPDLVQPHWRGSVAWLRPQIPRRFRLHPSEHIAKEARLMSQLPTRLFLG